MKRKICLVMLSFGIISAMLLPVAYADPAVPQYGGNDYASTSSELSSFLGTPATPQTPTLPGIPPVIGPVQTYIMNNELMQFAYNLYQLPQTFPNGETQTVSSNPYADFVSRHQNAYCLASQTPAGSSTANPELSPPMNCKAASGTGVSAQDQQMLQLGDIRFSALLGQDVLDPAMDLAAQNLIRTLIYPFPTTTYTTMVTSPTFLTNNNQQKQYANFMVNQAYLGVALNSFDEMYGMRTSNYTVGLASGQPSPTSMTSALSIMEYEATRRFNDATNYWAFLTNASTVAQQITIDMAAMQSFQMYMQYQQYRQSERIEALLAALLSKTVNASIAQSAASSGVGQ